MSIKFNHSILCISTFMISLTSLACECYPVPFSQEIAHADQIFLGTVLKKTIAEQVYYLFSVSQMFKGEKADTLTISSGFGGGDCGMIFEDGKSYIIYSHKKKTDRCTRSAPVDRNTDLGNLKFLFQSGFSDSAGKTQNPVLTNIEAEYFNTEFLFTRNNKNRFDFHQKKIAFYSGNSFNNKQVYFKERAGRDAVNNLIILTEKEKKKTGYDAIIISDTRKKMGKSFRKKLVKTVKSI